MADRPLLVAVLAAGKGARFGGAKLDALCAGKPLGQWALDAVAHAEFALGIIITGMVPPTFAAKAEGWELCINAKAGEGQGTSVALAAKIALAKGADLLMLLADMPLVTPDHLRALTQNDQLAATLHPNGSPGVPIFAPYARLAPFADIAGDRGAGPILRNTPGLRWIAAPPGTLRDVDTSADLDAISPHLVVAHQQGG